MSALEDQNESVDSNLPEEEVERLRRNVFDAWNNNTVPSARIQRLDPFNGRPGQVAIWTHYGASGALKSQKRRSLGLSSFCRYEIMYMNIKRYVLLLISVYIKT